jgi:hypothetical protein
MNRRCAAGNGRPEPSGFRLDFLGFVTGFMADPASGRGCSFVPPSQFGTTVAAFGDSEGGGRWFTLRAALHRCRGNPLTFSSGETRQGTSGNYDLDLCGKQRHYHARTIGKVHAVGASDGAFLKSPQLEVAFARVIVRGTKANETVDASSLPVRSVLLDGPPRISLPNARSARVHWGVTLASRLRSRRDPTGRRSNEPWAETLIIFLARLLNSCWGRSRSGV